MPSPSDGAAISERRPPYGSVYQEDAWLKGPGDLREADVEDVPVKGQTVRVRGLPAAYSNQAPSEALELNTSHQGEQLATVNTARLEVLQFAHGCVDPTFTGGRGRARSRRSSARRSRKSSRRSTSSSGSIRRRSRPRRPRFRLGNEVRMGRQRPLRISLPLGVADPWFMCELALEMNMPVGELGQRMSNYELCVVGPRSSRSGLG